MSIPLPVDGERFAALALWCVPALGEAEIARRTRRAGSLEAVLAELPAAREAGLRALEAAAALGAQILLPGDAAWPPRFSDLKRKVGALFVRGELRAEKTGLAPAIAIVGSRHATAHGLSFAEHLASDLGRAGSTIISGGALGIDGAAHRGALGVGGATVAVLGSGLDRLYPPQHVPLLEQISERGGALVTEYPFGTAPLPGLFPRRNRLIAALSQAVVVVQAAARSGSLVTAREAAVLGVPVLAVPGSPGDAVAEGTNELLRNGAKLCTGSDDVRRLFDQTPGEPTAQRRVTGRTAGRVATGDVTLDRVAALLGVSPRHLDELSSAAGLSAARTAAVMARLELMGLAHRAPGGQFCRPPRDQP